MLEERRRIRPVLERDITGVGGKKEDITGVRGKKEAMASVGEEYH